MDHYSVQIYYDNERQMFVATVAEFVGLEVGGKTRTDALTQAESAIKLYLAHLQKEGKQPPKPKTI